MSESTPFSSVLYIYICLFSYCSACWSKRREWYTYFNPEKKSDYFELYLTLSPAFNVLQMSSLEQFFAEGFLFVFSMKNQSHL